MTRRRAAAAATAVLAISVFALPWFALDGYRPDGWNATWWARLALLLALLNLPLILVARDRRLPRALAALALAAVALRVAFPPDFGFGFDGLSVPVHRRAGCWIALASAALSLLLLSVPERRPSQSGRPAPPPGGSEGQARASS